MRPQKPAGRRPGAPRSRRLLRGAAIGAAPVAGVFLWIFGVGWYTREPGLYFRLQESWQRASSPLSGLAHWAAALPERISRGEISTHPAFLVDYLCALLFLLLGIYQTRRRRWADASWTAGALLLPASTGISASLPRYLVVVYPAFYALAEIFRARPALRWLWWVILRASLLAGDSGFRQLAVGRLRRPRLFQAKRSRRLFFAQPQRRGRR